MNDGIKGHDEDEEIESEGIDGHGSELEGCDEDEGHESDVDIEGITEDGMVEDMIPLI